MTQDLPDGQRAKFRKTPFPIVLLKSFHSVELYEEVRLRWNGRGFLYLLALVALVSVLHSAGLTRTFKGFVAEDLPSIIEPMPEVRIHDGVAEVDAEQPFVLEAGGTPVAIFDTTGKVASLENTDAVLLLTRSAVQFRGLGGQVTEAPLADFGTLTINREQVTEGAEAFATVLPLLAYPFLVVMGYLYRIFQMLAFGILARLVMLARATTLDFDAVLRLTAVSLTPAALIEGIFLFLNVQVPMIGLFYQLVAAAYVYQTMRTSITRSKEISV